MMFLQMNNSRGMDDLDDITVENVVVKEKSSTKDNVELVELGSSSDEEECSTSVGLFNRSQVRPQAVRVFRPIVPAWGGRSSAYFQQRIQAARLQQLWSRKRRNSNDYDVAEVSSEGRLLVNVGKPAGDPDVHIVDQLTNVLQPHQLQGVKFMYDNVIGSIAGCKQSGGEGCILAHSMGLGKTLQVITFVEVFFRYTEFKRVIIVCPVNTIQNWANEFEKWLPSSSADEDGSRQFTVHLLNDSVKGGLVGRAAFVENWHQTGGVLLISYDMFKMLTGCTAYKKKGAKPFDGVLDAMVATGSDEPTKPATDQQLSEFELKRKLLAALVHPGADMIVCDEGHQIKNMKTEKSASLNAVSTKRRIVLTGYPLQNNLQEYYCMVSFVRPGYLGSKKNFREMFEKPINAALASDAKPAAIRLCKMRTHVLQMKLAGFVQRRTQHLLKKILPDSREYVVLVRKSPIQQEIYRAFVNETNSDIYDQNASFNPLRAHTICVKVLNHPDMLYFACKERMKRESQKQPKRGDADNSNSSNSLSNNLTSNENRSEPPTSNGISLKIDGAANSALGLTTSTYGGSLMLTDNNWSFGQFQNLNSESCSNISNNASNYSANYFNSTNFSNYQQQHQESANFNANLISNNNNSNIAQLFPPFYSNQPSYSGFNFYVQKFPPQSQWNNCGGYSYNGQNNNLTWANGGEMGGGFNQPMPMNGMGAFNASDGQFSLRQSLMNSFSADGTQQPLAIYHQSQQQQHYTSNQPPLDFAAMAQGNDVKPVPNEKQSKFSAVVNHLNNSIQPSMNAGQQGQQTDVKFNLACANNQFTTSGQSNVANMNKISVTASARFSNAIKTISSESDNGISSIQATNSGCAAIPQPTFDAIRPTTIVNAQLPTLSTSSNASNFCVADDQRPSTSAEATAGVKCRMAKTERVTLGDALLDDDEKIDNSIKLEWAHVPLRNYKSGILENSSKMKLAFSIIDETTHRGEKILFFSSSVNTLNTFESFLCQRAICGANGQQEKWRKNVNYCRFDGRTTGVERERLINRFNGEPELLLFLISTKAGSLGINLVSANRVIIFEASWNPCDDAQAICRIYRYGQRKRTFIYRLIMNNSMEKAIFHRQIAKSTLQQKVVDHQDIDAKVSTKELETLFQYDDNVDFKPIEKNLDDWALDDDLLMKVARENTNLFADVPFLHESLMLESEEKLSEEEKYEAELLYEREMRGGYLGGWCEELEFNRYTSSAALIGRPVASGVGSNDIVPGAMMSFPSSTMSSAAAGAGGSSGLVDTNGFPRLFPPDFAFIHPDAVAFNRAFRRLGEESMMIPPQAPYTGPIQLDETLGSENQVLPNPTPYPKLLREDANASSTTLSGNDDDSATAGGSVPEKSRTLAEVLDSLMSENPSLDASSSESIAEVCSTGVSDNGVSGGIDLLSGSLQRPPSIALLRRPISVMQHPGRPYSITSDGRVVISQDIELSSIRSSGEKVKLRAGELVVLCRTVNGTYIKTGSGNLLDASNTIYATAMPRLPMSLQRRPIGGMTASGVPPVGKKHRFAPNEVIELE